MLATNGQRVGAWHVTVLFPRPPPATLSDRQYGKDHHGVADSITQ